MQVQLAWPWTGPDGKKRKKGDVVDVPEHTARTLKRRGWARDPEPVKPDGKDTGDAGDGKAGGDAGQSAGKGRQRGADK